MKSSKLFTLLTVAVLGATSIAVTNNPATIWSVDKEHTSINFEVRHFFSNVPGTFNNYDATIFFDPQNLEESNIDVAIQVASVDTKNERRDNHLRTADFFDAETYPTITFTSSKIVATGNNEFVAKGQLTIKDITKSFELPFKLLGVMDHPWQENTVVAGMTSEFQILRNDYGVGTGNYVSDAVIGNEINVKLNIELNATSSGS